MSDTALIQDCLAGNQLAYKQLYNKYIAYCYGMCQRYGVNQPDIKDMVQVIFSQTFQSLKNYDPEKAEFKTWFTHVCINNILSYKRKQGKKLPTQELDGFSEYPTGQSDNYITENIDKQHLLSLLKKMPANYQIVFNLFIIEGYSHEEIAEKLNISIASSRVTLNRARKWVKKTFFNEVV